MAKEMAEMCRKRIEGWKTFSKDVPINLIECWKTFSKDVPRQQVVIGIVAISIASVAYADGVFGPSAVKTKWHRINMEDSQTMAIGVAKEILAEAKEIRAEAKEIRAEAKEICAEAKEIRAEAKQIIRKQDVMIKLQQDIINRSNRGWFGSWSKGGDAS